MRRFSGVDLQHLGFDLLPDRQNIGRRVDATPGDVGHMQQAIDPANIDKCAIIRQVAHRAGHDVAFLDLGIALFLGRALLVFGDDAPVDDQVFLGDIQLGDAAADLLPNQLRHLGGIAHSTARRRHEGTHPDIDAEAAFYHVGHGANDGRLLGKRPFQPAPVLRQRHAGARELVIPLGIASLHRDQELVARLYGFASALEPRQGQDTLAFVADIEQHGIVCDRNHCALKLFSPVLSFVRMAALVFGEKVAKGLV